MGKRERDLSDDIAERWDPDRLLRFVSKRAGRGEKLDAATRAHFEAKLGADLGHVRVFRGELAEEITRAQAAEAVTVGTTGMILMSGSPDRSPATSQGRALLAHELTHVAQGERGLHRATRFAEATPLATEEHEQEAELIESLELGATPAEDPSARERRAQEVRDAIIERVVDLLDEDARVRGLRGGCARWRV
jgi:hypothetical protein